MKTILTDRLFLLMPFFFLIADFGFSQDIIYKKDGSAVEAEIQEVSDEFIKYRLYNSRDDKILVLNKNDALSILYKNGRVERFSEKTVLVPGGGGQDPTNPLSTDNQVMLPLPPVPKKNSEYEASEHNQTTADYIKTEETTEFSSERDEFRTTFRLGIQGGINAATGIYTNKTITPPPSTSIGLTYTGGLAIEYAIARKFSLNMHLLYKGKGDKIDMGMYAQDIEFPVINNYIIYAEGDGNSTSTIHYGEFSIVPTLVFPSSSGKSSFILGIGGYLGSAFSGKQTNDYTIRYYQNGNLTNEDEVNNTVNMSIVDFFPEDQNQDLLYIRRIDYGLYSMLGWKFSKFMIGLSSSRGMVEIEPDLLIQRGEKPKETKNLVLTLFFNYYFF